MGGVSQKQKSLQKFSEGHNSADIWCTVTSKYALLHTMSNNKSSFTLVGGVNQK